MKVLGHRNEHVVCSFVGDDHVTWHRGVARSTCEWNAPSAQGKIGDRRQAIGKRLEASETSAKLVQVVVFVFYVLPKQPQIGFVCAQNMLGSSL